MRLVLRQAKYRSEIIDAHTIAEHNVVNVIVTYLGIRCKVSLGIFNLNLKCFCNGNATPYLLNRRKKSFMFM